MPKLMDQNTSFSYIDRPMMPDPGKHCLPGFSFRTSITRRCRSGVTTTLAALLLGGCLTQQTKDHSARSIAARPDLTTANLTISQDDKQHANESPRRSDTINAYQIARNGHDLWVRLRQGLRLTSYRHPRIARARKWLLQHPPTLYALIERSRPFLRHVLSVVEARDLPTELALLPAVESRFQPFAYSPDGATGLWQFMPVTARRFGLRHDWWCDERRDPLAATNAALDYLEYLLRRFDDDYLLTLAAYNAGPAKVSRAVRRNVTKGRPTDFWSLRLPGETERYVPRLLALAQIIRQPKAYGIELPPIADEPYLDVVKTDYQVDLQVAARLIDVPLQDLLTLNAGFNRVATCPDGPHRLLVPMKRASDLRRGLDDLPPDQRLRWHHHKIKKGETLRRIASRYQVTVNAILQSNKLSSDRIRAGQELLIPLSEPVIVAMAMANTRGTTFSYRVRKGDSLYVIARRFQVTVAELRRWNDIVGRLIRPGQRLTLFLRDG